MSCYLLLRDRETGEAIGLATCDYPFLDKQCIECMFDDNEEFHHLTVEHIAIAEYETYKTLRLFKEYTWADSAK